MDKLRRIKNILSAPSREWAVIKDEKPDTGNLLFWYVIIPAIIPSAAGLAGYALTGVYLKPSKFRLTAGDAVLWSALSYVQNVLIAYITTYVTEAFSRTFRANRNYSDSVKVVVYSYLPVWILGIFYIVPGINFLAAAGWIYMMILMYSGLRIVKETPTERVIGYEILIYCVVVILYYFINLILTWIAAGILK